MREQTNKILKTLCVYLLVISMMLSSLVGSWDVMAAGLRAPKINPVSPGVTEITGSGALKKAVGGSPVYATVHVILKGEDGTEKDKGSFTRTEKYSSSWKVTLSVAATVGDTVVAYNQIGEEKSPEATVKVEELLADKYNGKLKMPSGQIWIEQTDSNIVNDDEQAEAVEMFNNANTAIAGDIKSVKFSIDSTDHAYYEVTYTDGSTSGKVEATGLKIKQVTEHSQVPTIKKTYIADGQITITLDQEIAAGTKIGIVKQFLSGDDKNFCSDEEDTCATGNCSASKSSSTWVTVDSPTNTFTYPVDADFLELGREFGVIVKEPRKLASCKRTTPKLKIPNVGVRDPKNLTEKEKDEIRQAIRKANTREDGVSKLPDWTVYNVPAIIDFDKDGNVKIINPSKVQGDWTDNGTKFVPKKNDDGSIKLNVGEKPEKTIEPKEVLENLPPNQPTVSYKKETGEITVTPDKADTDAKTVVVEYQDPDGNKKTETVTKGEDGNWKVVEVTTENSKGEKTTEKATEGKGGTWNVPESSKVTVGTIEIENGDKVVTLKIKDSDIKNKTNVSATVTDEGGIAANDTDKKTSDNNSEQIKIYPKKPEITVNKTDGSVTITPVDKDKDKVAKKMDITYTPAGKDTTETVTIERKDDGTWTVQDGTDFKVSEDGKSITITNDKIKSKTDITAKTNDGDANDKLESDPDTKQVPDKTAPKPPTVEVDTTDGTAHITPPTDPDVKTIEVKYPGADGNEKKFTATKTDTCWEISRR